MFRRRTRALFELGMSVVALFAVAHLRRQMSDEPIPLSPGELATGALTGAILCYVHDCDVGNVRTSRRRRVLVSFVRIGLRRVVQRLFPDSDTFRQNFGFGELLGTTGYRLWYGLLHPLPGDD
jgi:hypothetical protein